METQKHTEEKIIDKLKIIYNSDMAISDFLSDLKDRRGITHLQKFVNDAKGMPGMLLLDELTDGICVLVLYKSPFGFNDPGNDLILYADTTLRGLIRYFKNQIEHTSKDTGNIYKALDDITRHLYFAWVSEEDNDTPSDFRG